MTLRQAKKDASPDSDVRAVQVDRVVSVTPLSLDLTSRADMGALDACLRGDSAVCLDILQPWMFPVTKSP